MLRLRQGRELDERHAAHQQLLGVPRRHRDDGRRLTAVVAVDLASRRTRDVGVAVLHGGARAIRCELERGLEPAIGPRPEAAPFAAWLADLAARVGASRIAIDGSQAWKDPSNGLEHQRVCERALATQAKTGPPGVVKPGSQLRFVELSIALFDGLAARGFPRLDPARPDVAAAVEVYPTASWRALGTRALPAKGCATAELARCRDFLASRGLRFRAEPTHDELQAAVAGYALLGPWRGVGLAPYEVDGSWREGVIVVPDPAKSSR